MSALGHKRTYAVQKAMSALPPIATAKADSGPRSKRRLYSISSSASVSRIHWYIELERFGGCHVDDEIDLARQLYRHIGGCRPFENPASVDAGTTIGIGLARSVAHKDAGFGVAAKGSARRQRIASRQRGELSTSAEEIWRAADEQPAGALLGHCRKSGMEFALVDNFQSGLAGQSFDQPSPPPPYRGRLPARPDETSRRWRLTGEPSRATAPAAWRPNQKM